MALFGHKSHRLKHNVTASDDWQSKCMQADTNLLASQMQKRGQKDDGPVCSLLGSGTTHITERLNEALMAVDKDPLVMTHLASAKLHHKILLRSAGT